MNEQARKQESTGRSEEVLLPPVDVVEDAHGITLYADMPGVAKDKLEVRVDGDTLALEGSLGLNLPEGMEANHVEVAIPRYRRTFTLSSELDSGKVSAEFRNGVLKLRIPKAEHAQPRKIEIHVD